MELNKLAVKLQNECKQDTCTQMTGNYIIFIKLSL